MPKTAKAKLDLMETVADLQREVERLRTAFMWEVVQRACIHTTVRSGFGVGCSRCHAAAMLLNVGWHSMIDEVHPDTALAQPEPEEKGADEPG